MTGGGRAHSCHAFRNVGRLKRTRMVDSCVAARPPKNMCMIDSNQANYFFTSSTEIAPEVSTNGTRQRFLSVSLPGTCGFGVPYSTLVPIRPERCGVVSLRDQSSCNGLTRYIGDQIPRLEPIEW